MKVQFVLLASACLIFASCEKDGESKYTKLLTSKTWSQPTVLHRPGSLGYWSESTCSAGAAIVFYSDGNYNHNNYCQNNSIDGKWNWTVTDKEVKLETSYQGIKQKTFILTIVELSDTLLITREREENEPIESYFELKYKPRQE